MGIAVVGAEGLVGTSRIRRRDDPLGNGQALTFGRGVMEDLLPSVNEFGPTLKDVWGEYVKTIAIPFDALREQITEWRANPGGFAENFSPALWDKDKGKWEWNPRGIRNDAVLLSLAVLVGCSAGPAPTVQPDRQPDDGSGGEDQLDDCALLAAGINSLDYGPQLNFIAANTSSLIAANSGDMVPLAMDLSCFFDEAPVSINMAISQEGRGIVSLDQGKVWGMAIPLENDDLEEQVSAIALFGMDGQPDFSQNGDGSFEAPLPTLAVDAQGNVIEGDMEVILSAFDVKGSIRFHLELPGIGGATLSAEQMDKLSGDSVVREAVEPKLKEQREIRSAVTIGGQLPPRLEQESRPITFVAGIPTGNNGVEIQISNINQTFNRLGKAPILGPLGEISRTSGDGCDLAIPDRLYAPSEPDGHQMLLGFEEQNGIKFAVYGNGDRSVKVLTSLPIDLPNLACVHSVENDPDSPHGIGALRATLVDKSTGEIVSGDVATAFAYDEQVAVTATGGGVVVSAGGESHELRVEMSVLVPPELKGQIAIVIQRNVDGSWVGLDANNNPVVILEDGEWVEAGRFLLTEDSRLFEWDGEEMDWVVVQGLEGLVGVEQIVVGEDGWLTVLGETGADDESDQGKAVIAVYNPETREVKDIISNFWWSDEETLLKWNFETNEWARVELVEDYLGLDSGLGWGPAYIETIYVSEDITAEVMANPEELVPVWVDPTESMGKMAGVGTIFRRGARNFRVTKMVIEKVVFDPGTETEFEADQAMLTVVYEKNGKVLTIDLNIGGILGVAERVKGNLKMIGAERPESLINHIEIGENVELKFSYIGNGSLNQEKFPEYARKTSLDEDEARRRVMAVRPLVKRWGWAELNWALNKGGSLPTDSVYIGMITVARE